MSEDMTPEQELTMLQLKFLSLQLRLRMLYAISPEGQQQRELETALNEVILQILKRGGVIVPLESLSCGSTQEAFVYSPLNRPKPEQTPEMPQLSRREKLRRFPEMVMNAASATRTFWQMRHYPRR